MQELNVDQIPELLTRAKAYREAQVTECERRIESLKQQLNAAEESKAKWVRMIPVDIFPILLRQSADESATQEASIQRARLVAARESALNDAYIKRRGILPPEVSGDKSMIFSCIGSVVGAALLPYISWLQFGIGVQWLVQALALVGAVLGFFVGLQVFILNFVVDTSLERSPDWERRERFSLPRPQLRYSETWRA